MAHRQRCLLMAGPSLRPEIHALLLRLNILLQAQGNTLLLAPDEQPTDYDFNMSMLSQEIGRDKKLKTENVETLLILDSNPAYTTKWIDFASLVNGVKNTIHLGLCDDETAQVCQWHIPMAHFLESWGDVTAADGTVSIVQPLIAPLYNGKTALEMAALAIGDTAKPYEIVRRAFMHDYVGIDPEAEWRLALREGVKRSSAPIQFGVGPQPMATGVENFSHHIFGGDSFSGGYEEPEFDLVVRPSYNFYDGRLANNAWMHEIPDPITKIVWDNAAVVGAETASKHGWATGDVIELQGIKGERIEAPVYVMPGVAEDTICLTMDFGRLSAGGAEKNVGFDALNVKRDWTQPIEIVKTGKKHQFASTQDLHAIDLVDQKKVGTREVIKRLPELVRETTPSELRHHAAPTTQEAKHHGTSEHGLHQAPDLWHPHEYDGYRWGMAIDLTACIGCNACVAACYAENNIPVVGKEETARGRDMAWLRIDRYFKGDPEDPNSVRVLFQPVACQHCETAPCEQVCPVNATVHDSEGLNAMVYNRCVGTRYCSNNCPYKVRRFNYFNNNKNLSEVEKMKFNPDVTVRSRGVMEKCTYCVQRIIRTRIDAKNERRSIEDGEIQTACQQACPTQAIVFGDLNDPESKVSQLHKDQRAYSLLGELNTRPRTVYLERIRNV